MKFKDLNFKILKFNLVNVIYKFENLNVFYQTKFKYQYSNI